MVPLAPPTHIGKHTCREKGTHRGSTREIPCVVVLVAGLPEAGVGCREDREPALSKPSAARATSPENQGFCDYISCGRLPPRAAKR
jgi:hypothetical protein